MGYDREVEMIAKARARDLSDHALRVRPVGSGGDGARRCRRPGLPFRFDRRRLDRGVDGDRGSKTVRR